MNKKKNIAGIILSRCFRYIHDADKNKVMLAADSQNSTVNVDAIVNFNRQLTNPHNTANGRRCAVWLAIIMATTNELTEG